MITHQKDTRIRIEIKAKTLIFLNITKRTLIIPIMFGVRIQIDSHLEINRKILEIAIDMMNRTHSKKYQLMKMIAAVNFMRA